MKKFYLLMMVIFTMSCNCIAKEYGAHDVDSTFQNFILAFPEWTNDSINENIFFNGKYLCHDEWQIPRNYVKRFIPVEKKDKKDIRDTDLIYYGYGYRITTDALHILFLVKNLDIHDVKDGCFGHTTKTILTYDHNGKLLDHKDVMCVGDLWDYKISGSATNLQFFVEAAEIKNSKEWMNGVTEKWDLHNLRYDINSKGKIKVTEGPAPSSDWKQVEKDVRRYYVNYMSLLLSDKVDSLTIFRKQMLTPEMYKLYLKRAENTDGDAIIQTQGVTEYAMHTVECSYVKDGWFEVTFKSNPGNSSTSIKLKASNGKNVKTSISYIESK